MMLKSLIFCSLAGAAVAYPAAHQAPNSSRSYDCPPGYVLEDKRCTKTEVSPMTPRCPSGTTEENGQCLNIAGVLKRCPAGFSQSGKNCIAPVSTNATPHCADGYILAGNSCEKYVPVPEYCPSGYTKDKSGCAQFTGKLSKCPEGFTNSGKGCILVHTFPRQPTCSSEYTLENNSCVKFVPVPEYCPSGYTKGKSGCAQFAGKLSRCPEGFSDNGKACILIHTFPKAPTCPKEYTLEKNSCVKFVPVPEYCPSGYTKGKTGCEQFSGKLSRCPEGFSDSGAGCVHIHTYPRSASCADGYHLEDDSCVKFTPAPEYCPSGYVKDASGCAHFAEKLSSCPEGYDSSNGKCVRVTQFPKKPTCAADYALENNQCVKYVPVPEYCPAGYTKGKNGCAQFAGKLSRCPEGFTNSGNGCSRVHTFPKRPTCSADYQLENNQCVKYVPIPEYCPSGYTKDKSGCSQYAGKLSRCPEGYSDSGKGCKLITTFPKQPTCSKEYTLENNQCVKYVPVPAYCPSGYTQDKSGCSQYAAKLSSCPAGYTNSGKGCAMTRQLPKIPTCPAGYDMEKNKCKKHVAQPSYTVCNSGVKQGDWCVSQSTAQKTYSCQKGYTLIGNSCATTESYDCSTTTYRQECHTPSKKGGYDWLRNLYAKTNYQKPAKTPVCTQVPVTVPKTCTRTSRVAAMASCPPGYNQVGKSCTSSNRVPAQVVTPPAQLISAPIQHVCPAGGCSTTEHAPSNEHCPAGYTDAGSRCMKNAALVTPAPRKVSIAATFICTGGNGAGCTDVQKAEKIHFCPAGYMDAGDRCVKNAALITPAPRKVSIAATFVCTGGNGAGCTDIEKAELIHFCAAGYMDAGDRCVKNAAMITPAPRRIAVAPTMVCTDGNGEGCYSDPQIAEMAHFCPADYMDAGDRCVKHAPAITPVPRKESIAPTYACSGGSGSGCTAAEKADKIYFCPAGYMDSGDRCIKNAELVRPAPRKVTIAPTMVCTGGNGHGCTETENAEKIHFCPAGYMDAGDRCVKNAAAITPAPRKVSIAATFVCTGGNGSGCTDTEKAELIHFCPAGYMDAGDRCVKNAALITPAPRKITQGVLLQCENGLTLSGNKCITTQSAPYEVYCMSGYELQGDRCVRHSEMQYICLTGQQGKDGCVSRSTVPAEVTIVRTCTKGEKGC